MNVRHSLIAPADLKELQKDAPSVMRSDTALTQPEVKEAMKELVETSFTDKFPRLERFYADPPLPNQSIALVSFTPSIGAMPDKDGVFGMLKVRGTFSNELEASTQAESLIKNVDSYHSILYTYVGRPFPLSKGSKYITETKEIDIRKKITKETSEEIRNKRDEDNNTIRDLKEKEKELLEDVKEEKREEPIEKYTELSVKKAQLVFTYITQSKKMLEMKNIIAKTREELSKMDVEFPDCKERYRETYMEARKKAGLPDDDESFIKYMGDDLVIDLDEYKY